MKKFISLLPALIFVLLLLSGLFVTLISLKAVPEKNWAELKKTVNILSGESTRRFTHLLNQHFVAGSLFNQIERGIMWNLTGDLGPGVRAGCENWLFLADELKLYPDRNASATFRATLAAQLNKKLSQRGIELLIVVVPDKTRIEAAHLCGLHRSSLLEPRVSIWLDLPVLHDVESLDLTSALTAASGERYYRTDTHWNENGTHAAALATASRLSELKWAKLAVSGTLSLANQRIERPGDLIHLAGLDGLPGLLRPAFEMAQFTDVPPVSVVSDDLFGDAGLPSVALVGTSYSRTSNFVPFLEQRLGEPVANLARDGGDFVGAAMDYFAGDTFRNTPPKIIVWEIPERVIEMPVKDAEREWMITLQSGI